MTNDFDPKTIRKSLDALRAKHGADTPIGHRCSNLIEQLKNLRDARVYVRGILEENIAAQVADLARLSSGDTQNAEDRAPNDR